MTRRRKVTLAEFQQRLQREVKRRLIKDGLIEDPSKRRPKYDWHYLGNTVGGSVEANTKGEARGLIKKRHGFKGRLPADIQIVRLVPNADAAASLAACALGAIPTGSN